MERGGVVAQAVERVLDLRLEGGERRDRAHLDVGRVIAYDVELGSGARREADRFAELARDFVGVLAVERDALAELDRSVMVRGADENEVHQLKCTAGSARRTTITSAKPASATYAARRPDHPSARSTRYASQIPQVTSVATTRASMRSPRLTSRSMPTAIPSVSGGSENMTVRAASRPSVASDGAGRRRIVVARRFRRRSCQR